jgi:hypothetical protein
MYCFVASYVCVFKIIGTDECHCLGRRHIAIRDLRLSVLHIESCEKNTVANFAIVSYLNSMNQFVACPLPSPVTLKAVKTR